MIVKDIIYKDYNIVSTGFQIIIFTTVESEIFFSPVSAETELLSTSFVAVFAAKAVEV